MIFNRRTIQALFGFAISAGLLAWVVFQVEWSSVAGELRTMRYWMLIPTTLVLVVHYAFRVIRWHYLLAGDSASFSERWNGLMIGNFATYILPLRAGELIRPFYLSRVSGDSFSSVFASIIIERFFDLATVLLFFGGVLQFVTGLPSWVYQGAASLAVLAVGIFLFMAVGSFLPGLVTSAVRWGVKLLPHRLRSRVEHFALELLSGVAVLHDPKKLAATVLLTFAVWGSCFLQYYLYCFFFALAPSPLVAITITVMIALAVALPSAPGFVGVYEAACLGAFAVFDLPKDIAAAYSIVTHVHQYAFVVILGSYVLSRANLSLRDLRAGSARLSNENE